MRFYTFDDNGNHKGSLKCILNRTNAPRTVMTLLYKVDTTEYMDMLDTYVDSYGKLRHVVFKSSHEDESARTVRFRVLTQALHNASRIIATVKRVKLSIPINKCKLEQDMSGDFTTISFVISMGNNKKIFSSFTYNQYYTFTVNDKFNKVLVTSRPVKFTYNYKNRIKYMGLRK